MRRGWREGMSGWRRERASSSAPSSLPVILCKEGGEWDLTSVVLKPGESQESLLRRFRRQVAKERILSTVKKKRFFVSKSEQRRRARLKAVRRERQRQRRQNRRYRR